MLGCGARVRIIGYCTSYMKYRIKYRDPPFIEYLSLRVFAIIDASTVSKSLEFFFFPRGL